MEKNQDKGFTLVELLIVIGILGILGILATVTVFAVRGITDKGQENACSVEQRTLDTAIEAFYAQNQADPAVVTTGLAADGLTAVYVFDDEGDITDVLAPGLVPTYLKDAPDLDKFTFTAVGEDVGDPAAPAESSSFAPTANGPCVVEEVVVTTT